MDNTIRMIQQIKHNEEPGGLKRVLETLLDRPTSESIKVVSMRLRQELSALLSRDELKNKDLFDYLKCANSDMPSADSGNPKLEDAIQQMIVLAHEICPYLFGILICVQLSDRDLTEYKSQYSQETALERVLAGLSTIPSRAHKVIVLENKLKNLSSFYAITAQLPMDKAAEAHEELRNRKQLQEELQAAEREAKKTQAYGYMFGMIALRWISEMAHMRDASLFLPLLYMFGLMYKGAGLSAKGFDVLSKMGVSYSLTTKRKAVYAYLTWIVQMTEKQLQRDRQNQRVLTLMQGDNFNPHQWNDLMMPGDMFTTSVVSFSLIYKSFNMPSYFNMSSDHLAYYAMPNIDDAGIDAVMPLLQAGSIDVHDIMSEKDTTDVSLTSFRPLPSIEAKSSSRTEMCQQFFGGVGYGVMGAGEKPVVMCMDPEPAARLMEIVAVLGGQEGPAKNFIVPPAPFHVQEHLMKEAFKDVCVFVLVICPFLKWMQYRPRAYKTLMTKVVRKLSDTIQSGHSAPRSRGAAIDFAAFAATIRKTMEEIVDEEELQDEQGTEGAEDQERTTARLTSTLAPAKNKLIEVEMNVLFKTLAAYMEIDMQGKDAELVIPSDVPLTDDEKEDLRLENARKKEDAKTAAKKKKQDEDEGESVDPHIKDKGATVRDNKPKSKKPPKIGTGEYISTKKLKHFIEGLLRAYKKNEPWLKETYFNKGSSLVDYVFSVFDDQLSLAVIPFQQLIAAGDATSLYSQMPTIVCYLGWNGHPNLVKAYMFNLICLNHWKKHRPDILRMIGSICKSSNDQYIEHHHSIMARNLRRFFPGGASHFEYVRIMSVFGQFIRLIFHFFLKVTHSAPSPTSIDAEAEDMPPVPGGAGWQSLWGILRKRPRPVSSTTVLNKKHISEPHRQILLWENATGAQEDISLYLYDYFEELFAIKDAQQEMALVQTMQLYRPLVISKTPKYRDYYIHLLKNYIANAKHDDQRNLVVFSKTDLELMLDNHTIKNTLKPLMTRIEARYRECSLTFEGPRPQSFSKSGRKADLVQRLTGMISRVKLGQGAVVPAKKQVALVKQICEGRDAAGVDEPLIYYNATKDYTKREWDRSRLWKFTQETFIPAFIKQILWRKITGISKVLEPST